MASKGKRFNGVVAKVDRVRSTKLVRDPINNVHVTVDDLDF